MRRAGTIVLCICCLVSLAGCVADQESLGANPGVSATPAPTTTVQDPGELKYYPSDESLRLGLEHFDRGEFGLAAKYFEDAVTKAPEDVTAWVGLAASYDRIGRFDLADRAYREAIKLGGETPQILNNRGYSYMLRGRLVEARRQLLKAYEKEPQNKTIIDNIALLNSSERFIRRN